MYCTGCCLEGFRKQNYEKWKTVMSYSIETSIRRSLWLQAPNHWVDTINWKVGVTQKKSCQDAAIVLSILVKNEIDPLNFLNF